jgi:transaldolase
MKSGKPKHLNNLQVFLDSANPQEIRDFIQQFGFLDGHTTNPSLVAKSPDIQALQQDKLTEEQLWKAYENIVRQIDTINPSASISVEVYADRQTTGQEMFQQAQQINKWAKNIFVKFPCTPQGLQAATMWTSLGGRANMTLGFTLEQAIAAYQATNIQNSKVNSYFSIFIGRLLDNGIDGIKQTENIVKLYQARGDGHIQVLASSLRTLEQVQAAVQVGADIITAPYSALKKWGESGFNVPSEPINFQKNLTQVNQPPLISPKYTEHSLNKIIPDEMISNDLLWQGLERFARDWHTVISDSG